MDIIRHLKLLVVYALIIVLFVFIGKQVGGAFLYVSILAGLGFIIWLWLKFGRDYVNNTHGCGMLSNTHSTGKWSKWTKSEVNGWSEAMID